MRQRVLTVSGWLVAACVVVAGAGKPGEVRVRRLVVEDERGRGRIVMQEIDGHPDITLYGTNGEDKVHLGVAFDNEPMFLIDDAKSGSSIHMGITKDGFPIHTIKKNGVKVPRN